MRSDSCTYDSHFTQSSSLILNLKLVSMLVSVKQDQSARDTATYSSEKPFISRHGRMSLLTSGPKCWIWRNVPKKVPFISFTRCQNGKLHGRNFYCFFSSSNTPEVWGRCNSESSKKNQITSAHFWINMFALTGRNFDSFQKKDYG